jgi:hypothetical protein
VVRSTTDGEECGALIECPPAIWFGMRLCSGRREANTAIYTVSKKYTSVLPGAWALPCQDLHRRRLRGREETISV